MPALQQTLGRQSCLPTDSAACLLQECHLAEIMECPAVMPGG